MVSRIQIKAMKQVAGPMKLELAQYRDLEAFAQFSSDLDPATKRQLDRGVRVSKILNQGWDTPLPVQEQIVVIWAANKGHLDTVQVEFIREWELAFIQHIHDTAGDIYASILKEQKLLDETEVELKKAVDAFNELHPEWHIKTEE